MGPCCVSQGSPAGTRAEVLRYAASSSAASFVAVALVAVVEDQPHRGVQPRETKQAVRTQALDRCLADHQGVDRVGQLARGWRHALVVVQLGVFWVGRLVGVHRRALASTEAATCGSWGLLRHHLDSWLSERLQRAVDPGVVHRVGRLHSARVADHGPARHQVQRAGLGLLEGGEASGQLKKPFRIENLVALVKQVAGVDGERSTVKKRQRRHQQEGPLS